MVKATRMRKFMQPWSQSCSCCQSREETKKKNRKNSFLGRWKKNWPQPYLTTKRASGRLGARFLVPFWSPKPSLPTLGSWFQINLWSGCGLPALYLRFRYFLEVNGTQIVSNDEIVSPENGAICSGMRVLLFCGSTSVGQVPPLVIREYFAIWLGP